MSTDAAQLKLDQLPLFAREQSTAPVEPLRPDLLRASAERLAGRLSRMLGMDVRLAITDNRSTVISYRRRPGALALRVHHMFLQAPQDVVEALADYAGRGHKRAGPQLDAFIRVHKSRLRPPRAPGSIKSRGLFHALQPVFDQLNETYFGNAIDARIGWGRVTPAPQPALDPHGRVPAR